MPVAVRIAVSLVALCMIVAGIAALAGYPIWAKRTAGFPVGTYPIQSGKGPLRPVSIELDPSMNPLRFELSGRVDPGTHVAGSTASKRSYGYQTRLSIGRETIAVASTRIDVTSVEVKPGLSSRYRYEPALSTRSERVELPRAGRYDITVSAAGSSGAGSSELPFDLSVGVYRNEQPLPKHLLWQAIGLIAAGLILGWLFGMRKEDST